MIVAFFTFQSCLQVVIHFTTIDAHLLNRAAFLTMVPGGTGDSITRPQYVCQPFNPSSMQEDMGRDNEYVTLLNWPELMLFLNRYMGLLQEDFKRLKLGDIRVPLHDIVSNSSKCFGQEITILLLLHLQRR